MQEICLNNNCIVTSGFPATRQQKAISVSTPVTKTFMFMWQCYICWNQYLLPCFQNNPPACLWELGAALSPPPSSCPCPGSVGEQRGQGKGSCHFSVQAQPDHNRGRAEIRSPDFCFSDLVQVFGPRTPLIPQFWFSGSYKMCTEVPFIKNIQ